MQLMGAANTEFPGGALQKPSPFRAAGQVFSAKGAAFIPAWGNAPGRGAVTAKAPALKARFIPANGCVESRFQRSFATWSESWGGAPGWYQRRL